LTCHKEQVGRRIRGSRVIIEQARSINANARQEALEECVSDVAIERSAKIAGSDGYIKPRR
jgi:hypothetical protein